MSIGNSQPGLPYISSDQMREVDRLMVEEYHICLVQMMENAGRNLAYLARRRFLNGDPRGRKALVLAGSGGNGGGGLACARRLHAWGAGVRVRMAAPTSKLGEAPRHQLAALQRMNVPVEVADDNAGLPRADLIVDALIGYSLRGAPVGASAALHPRRQRERCPYPRAGRPQWGGRNHGRSTRPGHKG